MSVCYDPNIMEDFTAKLSLNELWELVRELRERNNALHAQQTALEQELASARHDLAHTQAELSTLTGATQTLQEDRERIQEKNAELQAMVDRLTNMLWGRRSEKRIDDSDQPKLFALEWTPEELSEQQREIIAAEEVLDENTERQLLQELLQRRRKRRLKRLERRGREEFPEHLERRHVQIDLDEEAKKGLKFLGIKVTERLRFAMPYAYVEVIERYEYVRPGDPDAGVISAPPPLAIVPGVKYDFSVIATIVAMKFCFHQPTYRQENYFAQAGYFMNRSTQNDLVNYAVQAVLPLFQEMWWLLLRQPILLGDDTRIRLLTRSSLRDEQVEKIARRIKGRSGADPPGSVTSYAWLYTGLDSMAPYNIFHWSLTHEDECIDSHLASFEGIFVGDATGPNARLEQRNAGRILHAGCNTHARREFVKAEMTHPREAAQALAYYQLLYDIEDRGRWMSDEDRLALRQREAVRVWQMFEQWVEVTARLPILPKSPLGKALTYFGNHRESLQRYLADPRLPIDNNQSEWNIRPLVVGRRNWTFLGHPDAAAGRLALFSIVSSAHRHHLLIYDYLVDILPKLAYAQQREPQWLEAGSEYLEAMLPDRWAAEHPKSVCVQRREEREDVAESQRIRRLARRLESRAARAEARQAEPVEGP